MGTMPDRRVELCGLAEDELAKESANLHHKENRKEHPEWEGHPQHISPRGHFL